MAENSRELVIMRKEDTCEEFNMSNELHLAILRPLRLNRYQMQNVCYDVTILLSDVPTVRRHSRCTYTSISSSARLQIIRAFGEAIPPKIEIFATWPFSKNGSSSSKALFLWENAPVHASETILNYLALYVPNQGVMCQ